MEKKIIIVGAGIAGLSTGCYSRMNGFQTTIFEMHNIPGGLCTAWKRKGYTFDISMHMLNGSKSGPLYQMWNELSVVQDQEFFYHDLMIRVEGKGKGLDICTDARRLEEQMLRLSPADSKVTKEFVKLISGRNMMNALPLKPSEMMGFFGNLKMMMAVLPIMGTFRKFGKLTIQEFAQRFQDPFLREAVRFIIDAPGWPMLRFPMIGLAGFLKSSVMEAGVPLGGSQKVVFRMADYYRKLGGDIHYKSHVKEVIIENDQAVGIRLDDGTEHRADIIIWAGDGHTVIFDIFGARYVEDEIRNMYDEWTPVLPLVHVMMGVDRDFSNEPHRMILELEKPIQIAGEEHRWLCFLHHCFDPSMAPPGKSAVEVWYATRYHYWDNLARDRARYGEEKKRIADFTIQALDKRWPGFASQVEVVDTPTPATYVKYTGNWQGSPDGWYITPDNMMKRTMLRRLPGLSGFHMVGQWTVPFSGTVMAALSGRQLIQLLCKEYRRPFVTSAP
ncbi:MAG: NAD(P)/FAD-dependent oxidoreductase [Deltaproteobacteria bacterium]|nr:NAD(P)/FAD-dependent oxidoreductase [Deltaproteobacteria bacterium]